MTAADADRWNSRYQDQPVAEPRRPDALNDELEAQLPTAGTALDVACGAGAQSAWLARRGLDVIALDVADVAITLTGAAAATAGVVERVDARVVDLDSGLPAEPAHFDVIVCQRFRATHLYEAFAARLAPGGTAVVTVLSQTGAGDPGPFHAPSGELRAAFDRDELELLRHVEGDGQESVVVRRTG